MSIQNSSFSVIDSCVLLTANREVVERIEGKIQAAIGRVWSKREAKDG